MPLMYPVKHVFRNWKIFTALLIGIVLAATFFAAICMKVNLAAEESVEKQLSSLLIDMNFDVPLNYSNLELAHKNITDIKGVKQVDIRSSFYSPIRVSNDNFTAVYYPQMFSFPNTSKIYDEWENNPVEGIPENYTYIIAGSNLAKKVAVGDNITTSIVFDTPKYYNSTTIYVNLTVAGFAEFTDKGYNLVTGNSHYDPTSEFYDSTKYRMDIMLISWENTLEKLWTSALDSSTAQIMFSVYVDREEIINPWNIEASTEDLRKIGNKMQNEILGNYITWGYVNNNIYYTLSGYQGVFFSTIMNFALMSLPIFFVAWYLGSTVSDVSFNIRRREIGLLSTKGLSSGQIQRMFLTEALMIGLIGGLLGVFGGLILNQYYSGAINLDTLFTSRIFNPTIALVTVIFGVILAFISVFFSARRASKIPAVEALRDYSSSESTSTLWKIIAIIALILGTYKIIVFAFGLNISVLFNQLMSTGGNMFLNVIYVPLVLFDTFLTYVGPFLFFWGFTKLVIRDSTKFQGLATKISSLMGDLGALAAKNVRRNPARLAAIAFIIALIIGYSVQVTGQIASQEDYTYRQVKYQAGADIKVGIVNSTKGQLILEDVVANVSGIRNASLERVVSAPITDVSGSGYVNVKLVDPDTWGKCAYYEDEWFTGDNVERMLKEMKANNNTIILDRAVAVQLDKKLYDEVTIEFRSCPRKLRIIGFFGPEPSQNTGGIGPIPVRPTGPQGVYPETIYVSSQYWSYIPENLFNVSSPFSDVYQLESFSTTMLIGLDSNANGTEVARQIQTIEENEVHSVSSFDQLWRRTQESNDPSTFANLQIMDALGLGLLFVVISASVGTALIAIVSLKERSREATLMSVRGLSYRQLVWMFLVESMAIITFAVILGVIVGIIIVYGNVTASSAYNYQPLITQRLVFPANVVATVGTYIALIYASTIGAVIVMSSQYVTKLEKMVRAR